MPNLFQNIAEARHRERNMSQPNLIHHSPGTGMDLPPRIIEKFKHQTIANQVRRMQPDRSLQLQKLIGAVVGRIEFPPELKPEQPLVEAARPLAIGDTQSNVIEH